MIVLGFAGHAAATSMKIFYYVAQVQNVTSDLYSALGRGIMKDPTQPSDETKMTSLDNTTSYVRLSSTVFEKDLVAAGTLQLLGILTIVDGTDPVTGKFVSLPSYEKFSDMPAEATKFDIKRST